LWFVFVLNTKKKLSLCLFTTVVFTCKSPHPHTHIARHCKTLQHLEPVSLSFHHLRPHTPIITSTHTHCNTLHHTATQCNTVLHSATQCNTVQHSAPQCNTVLHLEPVSLPFHHFHPHTPILTPPSSLVKRPLLPRKPSVCVCVYVCV